MLLGCWQPAKGQVSSIFSACESSLRTVWRSCMFKNTCPAPSAARCSVLPPRPSITPAILPVLASIAASRLLPRSAVKMRFVFGPSMMPFGSSPAEIPCDRNSVHVRARNPAENRGGVQIQHNDFLVVGNVQPASFCIRCQVIPAVIASYGNRSTSWTLRNEPG